MVKNYGLTLANIEILPLPAEPRMDIKRGMDHATKIVLEEKRHGKTMEPPMGWCPFFVFQTDANG